MDLLQLQTYIIDHIGYKSTGHRINDSNDKNNIYDFAFDFT